MAFTPRLPSFYIPVIPWLYDPDTGLWAEGEEFLGQFYYARRGQAGTLLDSKFLVYPLAADVLTDPSEWNFDAHVDGPPYECDAVQITQPTVDGDATFYFVLSVEPRWLGFPNEHRVAYLKRCTAAEAELITEDPPPPPPDTMPLGYGLFEDDECGDCEVLQGPYVLDLTTNDPDNKVWSGSIGFSCTAPDDITITINYVPSTGLLVVAFTTISLVTFVSWSNTVIDWDYMTTEILSLDGSVSTLCVWPATATVNPP